MSNEGKHIDDKIEQALLEDDRFQYREEDWLTLEARLNREKKDRGFFFFLPRVAAAVLLLVASILGYQYFNSTSSPGKNLESQTTTTPSEQQAPDTAIEGAELQENTPVIGEGNDSSKTNTPIKVPNRTTYSNQFAAQQNELAPENYTRDPNPVNPIQQNEIGQFFVYENRPKNVQEKQQGINIIPSSDQEGPTNNQPALEQIPEAPSISPMNNDVELPLIADNKTSIDEVEVDQSPEDDDIAENDSSIKLKKDRASSRFGLGLGLNPMSTTSSEGSGKFGAGGGLRLNYQASDRLSLSSGAFYSVQNHSTPGHVYENIGNYWETYTNSTVPGAVDARNQVIEVPTLVELKVNKNTENSVSLTGGVVHSITLHELHDFDFQGQFTYPNTNDSWSVKDNDVRLLNNARISAAYETPLSGNTRIAVEPFVNVPLKSTDWGALDLSTQGVAFTLKFSGEKKADK